MVRMWKAFNIILVGDNWIMPPNPDTALENAFFNGKWICPKHFYYPRIYVFDYMASRPYSQLPNCHICDQPVSFRGWNHNFRRVVDVEDCFFLISRRLYCAKCDKQFSSIHPDYFQKYPIDVQLTFPAVLSHRSALASYLVNSFNTWIDCSLGPAPIAAKIREDHVRMYDTKQIRYYAKVKSLLCRVVSSPRFVQYQQQLLCPREYIPVFSLFENKSGYAGHKISSNTHF